MTAYRLGASYVIDREGLAAIMAGVSNEVFSRASLRIGTVFPFDALGGHVAPALVEVSVTHEHDQSAFVWVTFYEGLDPEVFGTRASHTASLGPRGPFGHTDGQIFVSKVVGLGQDTARGSISALLWTAR